MRAAFRVLLDYWLKTTGHAGGVGLPALLLAGYAIENLAKSRLVEQGADWPSKRGHDLPWLARKAGGGAR